MTDQRDDEFTEFVAGGAEGCSVQAMPGAVGLTPLTLCPDGDGRTAWTLRVPDGGGGGYRVLPSSEEDGSRASGLLALVDLAASRW